MRLRNLDANFLRYEGKKEGKDGMVIVATLAEADGVMLQCPKCCHKKPYKSESGRNFYVGAHYVICWFTGKVPDDLSPTPGRWNPEGTGLDDLTFVPPGSTSVLITSGCNAHFFVCNGEVRLA